MNELNVTVNDFGLQEKLAKLPEKLRNVAMRKGLRRASLMIVRKIKAEMANRVLRRRSGRLSRSVKAARPTISGATGFVTIGSNVKYARAQEFGAVITPKTGQFLAIPISREFGGQALTRSGVARFSPRTAPGKTFVQKSKKGNLIIFRDRGRSARGKRLKPTPLFALKKSVTLPERPIWRPVLRRNRRKIAAILSTEVRNVLASG